MRSFLRDLGGRDPYEILQVPRNATTDEIIAAHRRLVRRLHPDSPTGDADAAALLNVARDILSDPVTRAEYDRFAAERAAGGAETTTSGTERAASGGQGPWVASDAGMPGDAAERPSAWDGEDVVPGAAQSPNAYWRADSPPAYSYPSPAYPPRYVRVPRPPGVGLGVTALVLSCCCAPIGLLLGIIGWARYPVAVRARSARSSPS